MRAVVADEPDLSSKEFGGPDLGNQEPKTTLISE